MNDAMLPYGFGGPSSEGSHDVSMPFAIPAAPMSQKRRRADDAGDEISTHALAWETQRNQQYGSPAFANGTDAIAQQQYTAVESTGSGANAGVSTSMSEHAGANNPYPDVSSYSQPYFYQQTHPSTYNSPWPPNGATRFAPQSNTYPQPSSVSAAATDMPFFPSQAPTETGEAGFDVADVQQQQLVPAFTPDSLNAPPFVYASRNEHGLARSDVPPEASAFSYEDASMHLKIQSLPILENLATQLIHTICKASFPQIQEVMRNNDDEESQAYSTLKSLFDQTRKVYSRETPFIDAIAIQMFHPPQQEIIRKANIATFLSSILGAHDVSFFHLNEFFMETFVPLGHRLLKWQGAIYLELKTQTYISALINSDGNPEAMLDELFPSDLDAQILTRHPDAPSLSPSEQDFIDRSQARRSYLLLNKSTEEAIRELPKKYQWQDFVREFALSVSKNIDGIMNLPIRNQAAGGGGEKRSKSSSTLQDPVSKSISTLNGVQALSLTGTSSTSIRDDAPKKSSSAASAARQPWTKAEEDALLSGLEKVNGPHWSQILALYGRGGSVSEVLKDRNQVQLKDKARNLKLGYLKVGKDVPVALRGVTGKLEKRGGARARAALGAAEDEHGGDADGDGREDATPDVGQSARGGRGTGRRKSKKAT